MAEPESHWKTWDGLPEVLRGPKGPTWTCSVCATEGNWACRICCRQCGAAPSSTRRREAIARHKAAVAKEKNAAAAEAKYSTSDWPKRQPKAIQKIWKGAWPKPSTSTWDSPNTISARAEPLAREASKVEKCLAFLHAAEQAEAGEEIIEVARKHLEAARAERDSAVPPDKARARLEHKIRDKKSKIEKAREEETRSREQLQKVTEELQKATRACHAETQRVGNVAE